VFAGSARADAPLRVHGSRALSSCLPGWVRTAFLGVRERAASTGLARLNLAPVWRRAGSDP
jgi:hypothetical protein